MQTPDDEQFEAYLKRFHPITPEPVPTIGASRSSRRSLSLGTWLTAVAAILVVGACVWQVRNNRVEVPSTSGVGSFAGRLAASEPLTMRSANAWLATAPTFKAGIDGLASRPQPNLLPVGKQSAVAVLSKEK